MGTLSTELTIVGYVMCSEVDDICQSISKLLSLLPPPTEYDKYKYIHAMNPININQLYNAKKNKQTKNKKQKPTNKQNHDNILMNWTYHDDHT